MIKFLIWAGLLYLGFRWFMKSMTNPGAKKSESDIGGTHHDDTPPYDPDDVVDAHYKDVMPDGDNEEDTNQKG